MLRLRWGLQRVERILGAYMPGYVELASLTEVGDEVGDEVGEELGLLEDFLE